MRSIYLAERRRWEEMQARFASAVAASEQEAESEVLPEPTMTTSETRMLEDFSAMDDDANAMPPATDAEIEAEIARSIEEIEEWGEFVNRIVEKANFTPIQACRREGEVDRVPARPGSESDDEEYDRLFLEMIDSSSLNANGDGIGEEMLPHQQGTQQLPSETEWAQMMEDADMMMDTSGA
jgi:hypothetical protein